MSKDTEIQLAPTGPRQDPHGAWFWRVAERIEECGECGHGVHTGRPVLEVQVSEDLWKQEPATNVDVTAERVRLWAELFNAFADTNAALLPPE